MSLNKKELIEFLKENLKFDKKVEGPRYGMSGTTTLYLKLGEEVLDEVSWDNGDGESD